MPPSAVTTGRVAMDFARPLCSSMAGSFISAVVMLDKRKSMGVWSLSVIPFPVPDAVALTLTKLFLFSFLVSSTVPTAKSELLTSKREKLSRFRVCVHDKISGTNATAATVAQASTTNQSATSFGLVRVFDDVLTVGPEMSSKKVGVVQGMLAFASQREVALLMSVTIMFTAGKYNGSGLTVVGKNLVSLKVKEMPIVGGTGLFRLAWDYVQISTYSLDFKNGLSVLTYDFSVYHY
ncbi:dirigent protein 22-like [Rhodamnia argentea]|uniref:Dirigent protein n=1 Tax=Rhodamnia argentea TaxID=178133 RepID=A0A8B8MQ76_9MYRT|nr:dirigent protein 22-like [Rhodamnia argentea]